MKIGVKFVFFVKFLCKIVEKFIIIIHLNCTIRAYKRKNIFFFIMKNLLIESREAIFLL